MTRFWTLMLLCILVIPNACTADSRPEQVAEQHASNLGQTEHSTTPKEKPIVRRPFVAEIDGQWIGNGICYGPHRDGQAPGADSPTPEQLLEDLHILTKHWRILRTYSSVGPTETLLKVIRENNIDMKVVVGAWIGTEATVDENGQIVEHHPEAVESNRNEVRTAIRLANEYPDIVTAITVGNETQVFWSFHKVRPAVLIEYIRQARAGTTVPVSTADVYTFWNSERSQPFADEVDFIMTHIYAMWNQQSLDNALTWTQQQYHAGLAQHPDHLFVIGEAGWATQKHNEGEQARLITGKAGEAEQARFYHEFIDWTTRERIPNFFFEAFDENWKGGEHPDEVEKHWGLYNEDRTPKRAMQAPVR